MIELNLKGNETYYINIKRVLYVNGFFSTDEIWTINVCYGPECELYIDCIDEQDFQYAMTKLKESTQ